MLEIGDSQLLTTEFVASEKDNYNTVSKTVYINVLKTDAIAESVEDEIIVYPNPVENILFINSKVFIKSISINNMSGKQLKVYNNDLNFKTLDLSDLTPGMYLINITTRDRNLTIKVAKR